MPSKTAQTLNYGLGDFETFLSKFSEYTEEPDLHYLTDEIFHLLLPGKQEKERRFDGGIGIWAIWALRKILVSGRAHDSSPPRPKAPYGFRLLPTSAHHDTLAPLVDELPLGERDLYGYGREGTTDEIGPITSGLPKSLTVLNKCSSLKALRNSIQTACRIQQILTQIARRAGTVLPRGFAPRMAELVFRQQIELAVLRQTPCPHRAIFLTYELSPESKAWVQWAREARKRVIHVMHGQRLPTYQVTMATDLVLLSTVDEPWFRERVDPKIKLWTTGHPRLEAIRKEVAAAETPAIPRPPRIAFFSQPAEGDYSSALRLRDWSILAGLKGQAEVRFRLHPREDRNVAVQDIKTIGADFIELSDAGLKEDLTWCDAIASSWSTVSMEAAACGKGVFWTCTTPEKYLASLELQEHGIGALLQRPEDWSPYLAAWSADGWKPPVIIPETELQKLGMVGNIGVPLIQRLGIQS
jgi:hypothetical protein